MTVRSVTLKATGCNTILRVVRALSDAFRGIWAVAEERHLPLRTAAFVVACTRVLEARALRGLYP